MSHRVLIPNLTVNHLGPRAGCYLLWCKMAAERFSSGRFGFHPHYEDHERVGYIFIMPDATSALRMAIYSNKLMGWR